MKNLKKRISSICLCVFVVFFSVFSAYSVKSYALGNLVTDFYLEQAWNHLFDTPYGRDGLNSFQYIGKSLKDGNWKGVSMGLQDMYYTFGGALNDPIGAYDFYKEFKTYRDTRPSGGVGGGGIHDRDNPIVRDTNPNNPQPSVVTNYNTTTKERNKQIAIIRVKRTYTAYLSITNIKRTLYRYTLIKSNRFLKNTIIIMRRSTH